MISTQTQQNIGIEPLVWLAKRLVTDSEYARDVWLIEIIGGPNQDCEICPNYNYNDLVDYYWPALISGVEEYSGQNKVDYVGYSNGCRVGLDSLKNWSNGKNNASYCWNSHTGQYDIDCDLSSNVVNTFIGIGCPGAFEGESAFSQNFGEHGADIINFFESNGNTHITGRQVGLRLIDRFGRFDIPCRVAADSLQDIDDNMISRSLADNYLGFITNDNEDQPGEGLEISGLSIIFGEHPSIFEQDSDGVVTRADSEGIIDSVNATTETINQVDNVDHTELFDDTKTEELVRGSLE